MTREEKAIIKRHEIKQRKKQLSATLKETNTRGRSLTVGTAFGGAVELCMRGEGGSHTWVILQPVEAVELLHQLAAGIGCHLHLTPRNDFASWRSWKHSQEELDHFRGTMLPDGSGQPPHAKAIEDGGYSTQLPPAEEQAGMPLPENNDGEPLAVETSQDGRMAH